MKPQVVGEKVVWGVPREMKPILPIHPGKMRLRLRNNDVGRVFFKTPGGIRHFVLVDHGSWWSPDIEQGRNFHPK